MASIQFLGGARTVTGSKHLLEVNGKRLLVDAGLFQGKKEYRLRNRAPLPISPAEIDVIALTHAHIDHSGYVPVLVRDGFKGRVLATHATKDLANLMLPDAGRLQEEEAATAMKLRYSRHETPEPLFTEADAKAALPHIDGIDYHQRRELFPGVWITFRPAGHILGSATIQVDFQEPGRPPHSVLFCGDLGRYDSVVLPDPVPIAQATTLLVESTYGDRDHGEVRPKDALCKAINEAAERSGAIIIPSFAIERAQELLYYLRELEDEGRIPILPVYVDSPMAIDATPLFVRHTEEHDEHMKKLLADGKRPLLTRHTHFTRTPQESKRINDVRRCIIISASGMAAGGRILHHLKNRLPFGNNTVLFVGYQAEGTRGRALLEGEKAIKIHGQFVPVGAQIRKISGFSAHADANEMMRWLDGFQTPPERVFCVHGEGEAPDALKARIEARGPGWKAYVPSYLEKVEL